jgi:ribosomal protein S18 acetylase RimI-like enzyme
MLDSYQGKVDYEGETFEDARAEIDRTLAGEYGTFILSASVVAEDDRGLVGASLVTLDEGLPFLAFAMTHPRMKTRGVASALVAHSLDRLQASGWESVRLVVTEGNEPAIRLYEKLGFRRLSQPGSAS